MTKDIAKKRLNKVKRPKTLKRSSVVFGMFWTKDFRVFDVIRRREARRHISLLQPPPIGRRLSLSL